VGHDFLSLVPAEFASNEEQPITVTLLPTYVEKDKKNSSPVLNTSAMIIVRPQELKT
jgi:hypothetical protein